MVTASELSDVGTVEEVRLTLGNADSNVFDQAIIERALDAARVIVANAASDNASDEALREAVISTAAYRTFNSSPHTTQKDAAGVSKEVDIETYLAELRRSKDDALDDLGGTATFRVF